MKTNLSIIVAIAENYAIGKNNDLLWHISDDLKHFKKITSGHTVIMGRKNYESLPIRPLPNRQNIVITQNKELHYDGCTMVHSCEEAVLHCKPDTENFIIGGGKIYTEMLPWVSKLYVTWVYKSFDADVYFPHIDEKIWKVTDKSEVFQDEKSGLDYAYFIYERI